MPMEYENLRARAENEGLSGLLRDIENLEPGKNIEPGKHFEFGDPTDVFSRKFEVGEDLLSQSVIAINSALEYMKLADTEVGPWRERLDADRQFMRSVAKRLEDLLNR